MNRSHRLDRRVVRWIALGLFALGALSAAPVAAQTMGHPSIRGLLLAEELEYGFNDGSNPIAWDVTAWIGGDWNRIRFKSEGETPTTALGVHGEAQLLYSRLVTAFWELQVGLRGDLVAAAGGARGRGLLVVGLEGSTPLWFEIEPALFVSHLGDVSARLRAAHDLQVTQRLIAGSSVELNVAVQSVAELGVGAGFNDIQLGLRVRYELARELAPYLGISWKRTFGETARLRRDQGQGPGDLQGVAGMRFWF